MKSNFKSNIFKSLKQRRKNQFTFSIPIITLLIYISLGVFFALLVFNIITIMVFKNVDDVNLKDQALSKYERHTVNRAERGKITDRDGNVLARDTEAYNIAVIVGQDFDNHIEDKNEVAKVLSEIMNMEEKEILKVIDDGIKNNRYQVEFGSKGRNIDYKAKRLVEEKELKGIIFTPVVKRSYPNGVFASHLIGMAELNEDGDMNGAVGIEKEYNKELTGKDGFKDYNVDSWNYIVPGTMESEEAVDGLDVELTIDSNIQLYLEESLDDMQEHFEPEELFAFVADAKTGEILGAGQRPSFNPDTREGFGTSWLNMLYEYQFEPGSTFKVFTLAAAIEEGKYDPNQYYTTGNRQVMDATIYDWEKSGWGTITYNEGLQYSSNTLMMDLLDSVGPKKMLEYYQSFGFGTPTKSEFNTEASGQIVWDNELQQKTSSFGQTISVTPIQMIQGFTALLNDGMMKKPYVVQSVVDPETNEEVYRGQERNLGQVISKETAEKTMEEMSTLVAGSLDRNSMYALDDYQVTGKSGTAQIYDEKTGGYLTGEYEFITSFIGYAPVEDPRIIVYYGIKRASKNKSETWDFGVSRGFNPLMERSLKYLDVKDVQNSQEIKTIKMEDITGQNIEDVDVLQNDLLKQVYVGEGTKVEDYYPKHEEMLPSEVLVIVTDGERTMPDLRGFSKRDALLIMDYLGLKSNFKGEGYVTAQTIKPGEPLGDKQKINFTLQMKDPNN